MLSKTLYTPYWWVDARPSPPKVLDIKSECDVAIVGAGYTGLCAAITLSRASKTVQVFDKASAGNGASSRNGGITSGSLQFGYTESVKRFGEGFARRLFHEASSARRHLSDFIEVNQIDCNHSVCGLFTGALTISDLDTMKKEAELLHNHFDFESQIIERDRVFDFVGSATYKGGILRSDIGSLHPAKFVNGLQDAATRNGTMIHAETPVLSIAREADAFLVTTSCGTCKAGNVIVATNGYSDISNRWLQRRLVPVTSRIVVTEELPSELIQQLMPMGRVFGEKRKLHRYFRPTPDGKRILLGGREPAFSNSPHKSTKHVRSAMENIFPELRGVQISYSWSGNVAFSRKRLPLLFRQNGIHYAVGYCGSGTVWAPWLGLKIALQILGEADGKSVFDTDPPPSIPFYTGTPWFMPAVITGYGVADWSKSRS